MPRRIQLGTFAVSSAVIAQYYGKAQTIRHGIVQDFENVFRDVDVLLTPSGESRVVVVCVDYMLTRSTVQRRPSRRC